jgi:hypothetical protein
MIIEFLLSVTMSFLTTVLDVIPNLPSIPVEISSAGTWVITQTGSVSGLFAYIYGAALYIAILAVIVAILNFEHLYHATMWAIRKIPMINIK